MSTAGIRKFLRVTLLVLVGILVVPAAAMFAWSLTWDRSSEPDDPEVVVARAAAQDLWEPRFHAFRTGLGDLVTFRGEVPLTDRCSEALGELGRIQHPFGCGLSASGDGTVTLAPVGDPARVAAYTGMARHLDALLARQGWTCAPAPLAPRAERPGPARPAPATTCVRDDGRLDVGFFPPEDLAAPPPNGFRPDGVLVRYSFWVTSFADPPPD